MDVTRLLQLDGCQRGACPNGISLGSTSERYAASGCAGREQGVRRYHPGRIRRRLPESVGWAFVYRIESVFDSFPSLHQNPQVCDAAEVGENSLPPSDLCPQNGRRRVCQHPGSGRVPRSAGHSAAERSYRGLPFVSSSPSGLLKRKDVFVKTIKFSIFPVAAYSPLKICLLNGTSMLNYLFIKGLINKMWTAM